MEEPENAEAKLDVAYSLGTLADVEARFGHNSAAVPLYRESFLLRQTMLRADPENVRVAGSLRYPLISWGQVAALIPDLDALREALAAFEALPQGASRRFRAEDIGWVHLWRADLARAQGRNAEACRHWDAALSGRFWGRPSTRQSVEHSRAAVCPPPRQ